METEFDTEVSGAETVDTSTEIPQQDTPDTGIASEPTEIQSEQTDKDQPEATTAPFSAGKEKFQVNGQRCLRRKHSPVIFPHRTFIDQPQVNFRG